LVLIVKRMEVDWLLLGYRAVASWSMQLGSRHRTPWRRSATRTLWADSYTFAKTERPSLDSATRPPHAEVSKVALAVCAVEDSNRASAAPPAELLEVEVEAAGRFTLPTFVLHFFLVLLWKK
jgi:hypothetical protein